MSESVKLAGIDNGSLNMVYDDGRVLHQGDFWDLARDAEAIGAVMRANDVPRSANRQRVMTELQLAGYWPARQALNDYMESCE